MTNLRLTHLIIPFIAFSVLALSPRSCNAQDHALGTWAAWFNNVRFSERWGMNNDVQFRAGKNWQTSSMLLIRPGVNYYVNARQTASLGYATTLATHELPAAAHRLSEHRIWQQYLISGKLWDIAVQHRLRTEQRFLKRPDETIFTQRGRYFIRGIIPIKRSLKEQFDQGAFASIQNEFFFNLQNKTALNGRVFDQNRFYTAAGYRFSRQYDAEVGYMNQLLVRNTAPHTFLHIIQLALYTRL